MGLSSSQARLLTLTGRMHDIEYKAAKLEAQKLQMANESRRVYDDYLVALDATKIQLRTINTDGSLNYVDATYNNLVSAGYTIEFEGLQGRFVPDADYDKILEYYNLAAPNRDYFIALYTNRITPTDNKTSDGVYEIYTADQLKAISSGTSSARKTYRLMSDIELDAPLGSKNYINLDGNGHTINITSNNSLFDVLTNDDVYNLKVVNENSTAQCIFASSITGTSNMTNVSVHGNVNSPTTGGNAGFAKTIDGSGVKIYNCSVDVNVCGTVNNGAFASHIKNGAEIKNCVASGSVQGSKFCGGFAAFISDSTVSNTVSNADVTINHTVNEALDSGGFCGTARGTSTFTNCTSNGNVTNTSNISGTSMTHTIGGFVGASGDNATLTFINCDSNSSVTSNQDYIAGFISCINPNGNISIVNCNANGILSSGCGDIAGFINRADSAGITISLTNCSSVGAYDLVKLPGTSLTTSGCSTGTAKSNNNVATGASLSVTTKLDSSDEIAAGKLYDEFKAGLIHKESDADMYSLSTHKDDSTWLTNMINCGIMYLFRTDKDDNKYQVSVATDTGLQEVQDEKDLRKAEAKYEADMKKIDRKDRQYDTELAALDSERNALKAEMETLKNVAKDNVESTFKLFS